MTSLEEKNNLLVQENENLKQYAKSVEKELELQEYNVFNLKENGFLLFNSWW